jgi:hypothetical protein
MQLVPLRVGVERTFDSYGMLAESWAFNVGDLEGDLEGFKKRPDVTVKDDVDDLGTWITDLKVGLYEYTLLKTKYSLTKKYQGGGSPLVLMSCPDFKLLLLSNESNLCAATSRGSSRGGTAPRRRGGAVQVESSCHSLTAPVPTLD